MHTAAAAAQSQADADADMAMALRECVAHVAAGRFDGGANRCFTRVSALASLGGGDRPPQRLARIMADGLARRLIGSFTGRGISGALMDSSGYYYFDRRSVRQARCSFFKLLPALRVGFVTINRAILDAMENEKFVHVIDLSGPAAHPWQWLKLMRAFHGRPGGAPQLRLTVVHDDGAFLAQTAALLRREAEALDMAFTFHPVLGRLETLELGNLHHALAIRSGDARAFSCALQMHRLLAVDDATQLVASMARLPQPAAPSCGCPPVATGAMACYSTEIVKTNLLDPSPTTPLSPFAAQASPSALSPRPQRAAAVPPLAGFLSAVRAVSPKVVCVMEQDAGDNVSDLAARFEEALHHYAAVFDALDDAAAAGAAPAREERAEVERVLLWEELKDVLSRDGSERRERHERLHQWAARMAGAGFAGVPLSYVAKMEADAALRKRGLRGYETRGVEGGCLLLCRNGWPLYSVSAWRPWPFQSSASGSGSSRQPQLVAAPEQMASTSTAWPLLLPPPVHSNLTG